MQLAADREKKISTCAAYEHINFCLKRKAKEQTVLDFVPYFATDHALIYIITNLNATIAPT